MKLKFAFSYLTMTLGLLLFANISIVYSATGSTGVIETEVSKIYDIKINSGRDDGFASLEASHSVKNNIDYFSSRFNGGFGGGEPWVDIFGLDPKTGKQKFKNHYGGNNGYGEYLGPTHEYMFTILSGVAPNLKETAVSIGENGQPKWKLLLPKLGSKMGADGDFYFFDRYDVRYPEKKPEVIKFSREGKQLWKYTFSSSNETVDSIDVDLQGKVVITYYDISVKKSKILALSKNGQKLFNFTLDTNSVKSNSPNDLAFGSDGTVYFKAYNVETEKEKVYALNSNGKLLWKKDTDTLGDLKTGKNGVLYFVEYKGNFTKSMLPTLRAMNNQGKQLWAYEKSFSKSNSDYSLVVSEYNTIYFNGEELNQKGEVVRKFLTNDFNTYYDRFSIATDGTLFLFKDLSTLGGDTIMKIEKYKLNYKAMYLDAIDSWAYGSIERLVDTGVISGYPDGTYRPNANVTKEEFLKLLLTAKPIESDNVMSNSFADVPTSRWSYPIIQKAVASGIVDVLEEGNNFNPSSPITREQMAVYVAKALELPVSGNPKNFTDTQEITNHPEMVLAAATNGIIGGYPDGSFKPKAYLSRAEVAVVITRIMDFRLS